MASQTPAVPVVLTEQQRADLVLNTLSSLQLDEINLQMQRIRAGGDGGTPSGVYNPDGSAVSIDDRGKQLADAQRALADQYKDVMPIVERMAADRAAAAEAAANPPSE